RACVTGATSAGHRPPACWPRQAAEPNFLRRAQTTPSSNWIASPSTNKTMLAHLPQICPIPSRRDTFPRRIGPRLIRARRDALLAQLTHVPVLLVRHVPEFDRVVRVKVGALESLRMEKPIT